MDTFDVALVTYARFPDLTVDDQILLMALKSRGFDARPVVWSDDSVDWSAPKVAVLRSMWDYFHRIEEFSAWLTQIESRTIVLNAVETTRWNIDKRYLEDLERRGIPVVPRLFFEPRASVDLLEQCNRAGWSDILVKPSISGSAVGAKRFGENAIAGAGQVHIDRLLASRGAMVQPYRSDLESSGERTLVFIGREFTHGFIKGAISAGSAGSDDKERPFEATAEEVAFAKRVLATVDGDLLYARVSVVPSEGDFQLMELELVDPSLRFGSCRDAVDTMADCIARAVHFGASEPSGRSRLR